MDREDSITSFYRQKFIDDSLSAINSQFRWIVSGIVLIGTIGFFFKGLIAVWLTGGLIFAALAWRRIRIQDARFEIAMEEIRFRFTNTDDKIADVHTSIGYIYGEKLGLNLEEGFNPILFLWEKKGALGDRLEKQSD